MNTPNTQQLRPQTLNALNEFLTIWNQDPLATNHSLVVTGNQVSVMNETNVFLTITIPTETENTDSAIENESEIFESLFPSINLDELLETEETTMLSQQEKENSNEEILEGFSLQELDQEENRSLSNDLLIKFIDDIIEDTEEVFIRLSPLIETTFKDRKSVV